MLTIASAAPESALVALAPSQMRRLRVQTVRPALLQLSAKATIVQFAQLPLRRATLRAQAELHVSTTASAKTGARRSKALACTILELRTEPFATTTVSAQADVATLLKEQTRLALRPLLLAFARPRLPSARLASQTMTANPV